MSENLPLIERMTEVGARLIKLREGIKRPTGEGWKLAPVLSAAEADAWTQGGGNLGVNLGPSKLIAFDCEDLAATVAVVRSGFNPTVAPAKHAFDGTFNPDADDREAGQPNKKVGGSHTWLRVPDYVDASLLSSDHSMQIKLPGGGVMDVLAGGRYVVAPPSALELTYGTRYAPFGGGALDLSIAPVVMDAPRWLFDLTVPCPEELAPLHGCLIPRVRAKVEQDSRSIELTNQIDEIPWDEWIAGDHRIMLTGQVDGCGCDIAHFQGASSEKSMTLHDGCGQGYGIHIWSGTMLGELNLNGHHLSRLDLACALRGESRHAVAAAHGIQLGEERQELGIITPGVYERMAADHAAAGDTRLAAVYRQAAETLRATQPTLEQRGETMATGMVFGAPAPSIPIAYPTGPVPESATPAAPPTGTPAAAPDPTAAQGASQAQSAGPEAAPEPSEQAPAGDLPPGAVRGVLRKEGESLIFSFPGARLEDVPQPAGTKMHEYPMPPIPAHVPAVQNPVTAWRPVLPPLTNRAGHEHVKHEWIFSATPGLSQIAAAADSRGVCRWGMLGALLPRVGAKIPATVRLIPANGSVPDGNGPTGSGTSINVFSVLVAPPASGKTDSMSAAATLIPGVRTLAPGTGEGVLKEFPRAPEEVLEGDDSGDSTGAPVIHGLTESGLNAESLLIESDEIDVFVGEMLRQGSKTSGWYRSMWMGGEIGNTASDRERRSLVLAHSYRFGILLGAQPDALAKLFEEAGRGTPQRFMWLPAQQLIPRHGEQRYPEQLQIPEVNWIGGGPTMIPELGGQKPPVWVYPPSAAIGAMARDRARAATSNPYHPSGRNDDEDVDPDYNDEDAPTGDAEAIANRHVVLQQLKISVLLAALDGLTQPQDCHWFAAEAIMEVRKSSIVQLVATTRHVTLENSRKRGEEAGVMQSTAKSAGDKETYDRREETTVRVFSICGELAGQGKMITRESVTAKVDRGPTGSINFVREALSTLVGKGVLQQYPDGTYAFAPPAAAGDATVTAMRADRGPGPGGLSAPPKIGSVG